MRCYKGILFFIILTYGFPSSASHTLGTFPQGKAFHKQSSPSFASILVIGKDYIEPRHYGGVFVFKKTTSPVFAEDVFIISEKQLLFKGFS